MEWPAATGWHIRSKHSSCRSQYLHTVKKAITELYRLDIDDPAACRRRAEYLLEVDKVHLSMKEPWGRCLSFPLIISNCSKTKSIEFGGQSIFLRFVGLEIPDTLYIQYYSSPRRKRMIDEGFQGKIDGPFICLTAAILCHSLGSWRTGNFIDNVAFTCVSSKGKTINSDLRFSEVSRSLGTQAPRLSDTLENCKYLNR